MGGAGNLVNKDVGGRQTDTNEDAITGKKQSVCGII